MASTIKIKRSSTPGSAPTGLSAGELAINLPDKSLYSSDGATVFRVGDKELANTNARIGLVNTNLTGTNTALRTLISDRLQVANAATTYQTKSQARLDLANTNTYIASKVSTSTYSSDISGINSSISNKLDTSVFNSALANTNSYIASRATWTALTGTNTALRTLISDRLQVANAAATYQTKVVERAALANTNSFIKAQLANTNSYIATKITNAVSTTLQTRSIIPETDITYDLGSPSKRFRTLYISGSTIALGAANLTSTGAGTLKVGNQTLVSNAYLTSTYIANTTARSLIFDRYQVANVNTNFFKKTGVIAQTVTPLTTFSANVSIEGKLFVTGGITSYTANNLSVGDNMIYLNSGSTSSNPDLGFAGNYNDGTYHHTGFFRDASDAGTWKVFENYSPEPDANVYINTAHATFRLAPFSAQNITVARNLTVVANSTLGNTSVTGFLKLNGTDIRTTFAQNTYVKSVLANTNSFIKAQLANTNSYIATKLNTTTFNSALANTNSYIATKLNTTTFNSALANTNSYIALKASLSGATFTGQVNINSANLNVAYINAPSGGGITLKSGAGAGIAIIAGGYTTAFNQDGSITPYGKITGASYGSNYLDVTQNSPLVLAGELYGVRVRTSPDRANFFNFDFGTDGTITLPGKISANGSTGTSGYYLRTGSTGVYWSPIAAQTQYLQVANAAATYATKASPTTSGLLAHTGRATISTNLSVSGNTTLGGTLVANNTSGSPGYYLRTSGSGVYWSPVNAASTTQYLQVTNAVATYATKVNPTTSGLLAHTGRMTISTNLAVSGNTRITGSTIIDGDLTVEGAVTYISSSTLNVDDSMIKLAANNSTDTVDVGFYGKYVSSGAKYAGIFRDASDGVFKVYTALQTEPTSTVDTGGTGYTLGTFDAIIDGGTY